MEMIKKTEAEWKAELTPEQYRVLRQRGTDQAFSGEYYKTKTPGMYLCAACGQELFSSETKYESGSGWPSFWEPLKEESVETVADNAHGMTRTEVVCSRCNAHLGHVFEDGPKPSGLRYCMNSTSLKLQPK